MAHTSAVEKFVCPSCGEQVARLRAIDRVVNLQPQPYYPGVAGWAFSRSRGWVRSDYQLLPPKEHLLEHWETCRPRSAASGPRTAGSGQDLAGLFSATGNAEPKGDNPGLETEP